MIKPQRGSLVELDDAECKRLDTPKPDRPWVVVQANRVTDSLDLMVCPMTGALDKYGKPKKLLTSYEFVRGSELHSAKNHPWRKDSYVKCGRVCTVLSSIKVKYVGFLLPKTMAKVDDKLRFCLDLSIKQQKQEKPSYRQVHELRKKEQEKSLKPSYSLARELRKKTSTGRTKK